MITKPGQFDHPMLFEADIQTTLRHHQLEVTIQTIVAKFRSNSDVDSWLQLQLSESTEMDNRRLRFLIGLTLAVSVVFIVVRWKTNNSFSAAVTAAGGTLIERKSGRSLLHRIEETVEGLINGTTQPRRYDLTFAPGAIDNTWISKHINEIDELGVLQLTLRDTSVTDSGVVELLTSTHLTRLNLRGTALTDAAIEKIATQSNLAFLDITHTGIADEGLSVLAKLQYLQGLSLDSTQITEASVAHLAKCTRVNELFLTDATDKTIHVLRVLRKLKTLNLYQSTITEEDAVAMLSIPNLRRVVLLECQISDSSIKLLNEKLKPHKVAVVPSEYVEKLRKIGTL